MLLTDTDPDGYLETQGGTQLSLDISWKSINLFSVLLITYTKPPHIITSSLIGWAYTQNDHYLNVIVGAEFGISIIVVGNLHLSGPRSRPPYNVHTGMSFIDVRCEAEFR